MAVYNVEKISYWLSKFSDAKTTYNNDYSKYKDTYIYATNESSINKIKEDLNKSYIKIQKIYKNIYNKWNEYLNDLKSTDNCLAGNGSPGSVKASSVSSKLSKLPKLKKYKAGTYEKLSAINAKIGTIKTVQWTDGKTADQNISIIQEKAGATASVAVMSVLEGVGIFAEGLVDCGALAVGGVATALNYTSGFLTNDLDTSNELNTIIWKDVRAFVSKDYVKSAFDSFYKNTDVGKSMKENAIGFDTVRTIGNEVGEVVGAVAVSALTGGVINPAVLYGISKAGTHTEENWKDKNTSTASGLTKGLLQGIGDGAFFAIGMKGDAVMKKAATEVAKKGGEQALKKTAILSVKTLFESGCSVVQDSSNILINALFSDNTVKTQDGKTISLNNFGDKLNYYYQEAGGAQGLVNSMATASILSFASDFVDVNKIGKNVNATSIKNTDINSSILKKNMSDINSKNINSDINIDSLKKEYNELFNKSKESWFVKAKEAGDNHYAWDLRKVDEADKITKRMKEIENILNTKSSSSTLNSNSINKNLVKLQSIPKTIAGIFTSVPAAISKMKNIDITPDSEIFKKIQTQGLYHFTDEISAKKILDSGYIKESNYFTSYGKKRTFLFAGVPTVEDTCLNSVFDYKKTAVKLHPSDTEITGLQYRKYSDSAISSLGNYDISNSSPEIVYLVLKEKDGVLKYTEVPKIEYDNFNPHFNDNAINKTIENAKKNIFKTTVGMSKEYDNVIKGAKQYANDIVTKLKEITKPTENNLKKTILSSVDSNYNEIQTMRKIYIELNKHTNYDANYFLGNENTKNSILNKVMTLDNLTNNNVVCKGWSELYAEALVESGIDSKRVNIVKAPNANHWWVEVDIGSSIIRADATDAFLGSTDLANCKFGESTNGFIILNKAHSGMRVTNKTLNNNPHILKSSNDYFRNVDKSINYVGDNGYFTENVTKLQNLFKNDLSPYDDIIKNTNVLESNTINYMSMNIPKNMNGYDAFAYYRKLSNTLFGNKNNAAVPSLKKVNIAGKDYSAVEIFINDGKKEYFLTFDEVNGKKIYSREEYLNGPINNYEEFK